MNTAQEEEEIKYIPEGAKCKSHVIDCIIRLQGLKTIISTTDSFPTYSSFGRLFPLKENLFYLQFRAGE